MTGADGGRTPALRGRRFRPAASPATRHGRIPPKRDSSNAASIDLSRDQLSQANLYGFGRLAWDPELSARCIAEEWTRLTFGPIEASDAVSEWFLRASGISLCRQLLVSPCSDLLPRPAWRGMA